MQEGGAILKDNNLLFFVHIEKAAGTSFKSILLNNYFLKFLNLTSWHFWSNEESNVLKPVEIRKLLKCFPYTKAISSHGLRPKFGYDEKVKRNIKFLTLLRNPLERYLSHFYFQINDMGMDWDFQSFTAEEKFNNFIVKKLTGENNLKKAKDIIDQFFFVGFVEDFDISLILLKETIGTSFDIRYEKRRVNSNKQGHKYVDEISDEKLNIVKQNNNLDMKLYNYAYDKFQNKINKISNLEKRKSNFKQENKNFSLPTWKRTIAKYYKKLGYRNVSKILNKFYHTRRN